MPSYYDPFVGYTPAGNVPSYYNPYQTFAGMPSQGGPANQTQPGQQAGQSLVPGKDSPTPGSKHGAAGRKVHIQHPRTGEVREVDAAHAPHYMAKGGRVV